MMRAELDREALIHRTQDGERVVREEPIGAGREANDEATVVAA